MFMTRSRLVPAQSLSVIVLACLLSACATPGTSTFKYTEPAPNAAINNEKIVSKPFSDTWDILVRELAKSFFVINNIDKASRIINLSFSTQQPKEYVNCGKSVREFKYGGKS